MPPRLLITLFILDLLNKFYRQAKNTENIPHWFEQSSLTENLGISQFNLN